MTMMEEYDRPLAVVKFLLDLRKQQQNTNFVDNPKKSFPNNRLIGPYKSCLAT